MTASDVFYRLEDYQELFRKEAAVIGYAKCRLASKQDLEDFHVQGCRVSVSRTSKGYLLSFDGYSMEIAVYDGQIMSFRMNG